MSKTPVPKTPTARRHSVAKPGSRNGLLPPPHLTPIKYVIDVDVIKCPVCLEVYKSPRVLPCGHSACLSCLNSLILYTDSAKTKESFQCPVCHKSTKPRDSVKLVKTKWAHQFPVNATIIRVLRNASIRNPNDNTSHRAFCEICLSNNNTRPAVAYCNSCLEHHCDMCARHHEKREETRDHEVVSFLQKDEAIDKEKADSLLRSEWQRRIKNSEERHHSPTNGKRVLIDPTPREGRLVPLANVTVAQTVTASDTLNDKVVVKLGYFNGKAPHDVTTSDFRGAAFLTDSKVALADFANKKIKVFDVSHKSRVELITEITLRVDPSHMCRVDGNTVAVITERSGTYHIRLFTVRDKIQHFVHRTIDGLPLGIGYLNNTIVCSVLEDKALFKYRLTRAQQTKIGAIKHDHSGNEIFRYPGIISAGVCRGEHVLYIADGAEFGITISAIDLNGEKKASIFFECPSAKPKSSKRITSNTALKSGRQQRGVPKSGKSAMKKDDASDTTTTTVESEVERLEMSIKQSGRKQTNQTKERKERADVTASGRHTFRRVDDFGRTVENRKGGREIERTPLSETLKKELTLDLNKIISDQDNLQDSLERSLLNKSLGKAVERTRKVPVGKVVPQPTKERKTRNSAVSSSSNLESTVTFNTSTNANSTVSSVTLTTPPKIVFRADSLAVDKEGNIYVCMSSANKIHQMSADGRVKRELLTEKDGLIAPKVVCFSPASNVFLVTCLKTNKVAMFRLK